MKRNTRPWKAKSGKFVRGCECTSLRSCANVTCKYLFHRYSGGRRGRGIPQNKTMLRCQKM